MITLWRYHVQIIALDKSMGDALNVLLKPFPGDPDPEESIFTTELSGGAWAAGIAATQVVADSVDEFNAGGYPDLMLSKGMTKEGIDGLRGLVKVEKYDLYPDGVRAVNFSALSEFIKKNGYTEVAAE